MTILFNIAASGALLLTVGFVVGTVLAFLGDR